MCDGSGVIEEIQLDVDFYRDIPCPGCVACDEDLAEQNRAQELEWEYNDYREAVPLWAGMQVYDAPAIPVVREYQRSSSAHAGAEAAKCKREPNNVKKAK